MEDKKYSPESAGGIMITKVPTAKGDETISNVLRRLAQQSWDDISFVYVISETGILIGEIPIAKIISAQDSEPISNFLQKSKVTVHPKTDQEKVAIDAIKNDVEAVPVVDKQGIFLGVVAPNQIIDILHMEHLEDFLRSTGIRGRGSHIIDLVRSRLLHIVGARVPWLIVGLFTGLILGLVTRQFESYLEKNIALVFFIPVIAYIADSVGTQTETIFIRASTVLKLNVVSYVLKEFIIGVIIGGILGIIGGLGAATIAQSAAIGMVVGISLFITVSLATVLACIVPIALKASGKDPALGSGPLATSLQDLISIAIYFMVAATIL